MTSDTHPPARSGLLHELMGYHLRRAQSAVFSDFMSVMADDQITPGQFGVLVLIDENTGLNQSALAKALGIERSTMVGVIDGLEKRGLVKRQKSLSDKRAHALTLTSTGHTLLNGVKPKVLEHEQRIANELSVKEMETLVALLKRIMR